MESAQTVISAVNADFWRCHECGRLCTRVEMDMALGVGGTGAACSCGSGRYVPANLPWYGWMFPRVLSFAILRIMGKA